MNSRLPNAGARNNSGGGTAVFSASTAPPIAHAISGSIGSALAIFLFYPLERARIELQSLSAKQKIHRPLKEKQKKTKKLSNTSSNRQGSFPSKKVPVLGGQKDGGGELEDLVKGKECKELSTDPPLSPTKTSDTWKTACDNIIGEDGCVRQKEKKARREEIRLKKKKSGLLSCLLLLHQRRELYNGVRPVVSTLAISSFIFFYVNEFIKGVIMSLKHDTASSKSQRTTTDSPNVALSLLASSLAGTVNVLLTNPLWIANLRIITGESKSVSIFQEMREIVEKDGVAHLWNGVGASLMLVSNPVINFVVYGHLKHLCLHMKARSSSNGPFLNSNRVEKSGDSLTPLEAFIIGALAKTVATLLTYPLQLTQTLLRIQNSQRKQEVSATIKKTVGKAKQMDTSSIETIEKPRTAHNQLSEQKHQYNGTLDCMKKIYKTKGVEGIFAGMRTKLLQTVLTAAFSFLTYEQILRLIQRMYTAIVEKRKQRIRSNMH